MDGWEEGRVGYKRTFVLPIPTLLWFFLFLFFVELGKLTSDSFIIRSFVFVFFLFSQMAEQMAFVRSDDPTLFPPSEFPNPVTGPDSTSGLNSPDLEFIPLPLSTRGHGRAKVPGGDLGSLNVILLR